MITDRQSPLVKGAATGTHFPVLLGYARVSPLSHQGHLGMRHSYEQGLRYCIKLVNTCMVPAAIARVSGDPEDIKCCIRGV